MGLPFTNRFTGFGAKKRDIAVISSGASAAAALNFTLNPTTLGAAVGDVMVVMAAWESNTDAVNPPAGWTENVDQAAVESNRRVTIHTIAFSSSVPGDQTFATAGATTGVAYSWCIVRNVTSVESVAYADGDTTGSVGADSFVVTLSGTRLAAVVGMCADGGGAETGETATLSNVTDVVSSGNAAAGYYAVVGFTVAGVTVGYTTTQFQRAVCGNYIAYLQ